MFSWIRHKWKQWLGRRHEMMKVEKRSGKWPAVEKAHLAAHGTCAACGGKKELQVHHEKPFHSHPELELEESNLITLCMDTHECHIRIGHGDSFHFYNPHVKADAETVLSDPSRRKDIEAKAKKNRLVNEPGGS